MIFDLDVDQKNAALTLTRRFLVIKDEGAIGGPLKDLSAALFNNNYQSVGFNQSVNLASALPGAGV